MKVTFKNLGPIEEATLDLSKRLTVLVGKNNTGKTFLASAAYAVNHQRTPKAARREVLRPLMEGALRSASGEISREQLEEASGAFAAAWAEDVAQTVRKCLGLSTTREVEVAIEWSATDRRAMVGSNLGAIVLTMGREPRVTGPSVHLHDLTDEVAITIDEFSGEPEHDEWLDSLISLLGADQWDVQPAERLGIQVFAPELSARRFSAVDEFLDSDSTESLRGARSYPWVVRDALLGNLRSGGRKGLGLEELVGGGLETGRSGLELVLATGQRLSINELSSSVKSLASLALRQRTASNTRVLVDEPEMSLHPDLQRKFARWLGRAVGEGQQFLIATHSDYIVRELSHLLMMHNASPAMRKVMEENGYAKEEAIDPAHVEVLRLGEGRATPIEVDRHGFRVDTIDDELERISALSQDLFAVLDEPAEDASGE